MRASTSADSSDLVVALAPSNVLLVGDDGALEAALRAHDIAVHAAPDPLDLVVVIGALTDAHDQALLAARRVLLLARDESALIEAMSALAKVGFLRAPGSPDAAHAALLMRGELGDLVERYELWLQRLRRQVNAYHLLSLEYRQELVDREQLLERLQPLPTNYAVAALFDDLLRIRHRFAPERSWRTRAVDWTAQRSRTATSTVLRLFDLRDVALQRGHRLLREMNGKGDGPAR